MQIEIIPDRLIFVNGKPPPGVISLSTDHEFTYEPFMHDFGPLNLAAVFRFCRKLEQTQKEALLKRSQICHYSDSGSEKLANAVLLMGAFQIIVLKRPASESWSPFSSFNLKPFRDPSVGICTYKCTVLHCLEGLEKAIRLNWFCYSRFDLKLYEKNSTVEEGDLNWIIPGKMLAFSSPSSRSTSKEYSPEKYGDELKSMGISAVVRLNEPLYESSVFTRRGIKFFDLFFPDGSCPSPTIVNQFLKIADENRSIAVHCKAGLGRTGTLIACYAIKKHGFSAQEFIAWARLCRPGSVIGPQQEFLIEYARRKGDISETTATSYEKEQGERLVRAKKMHIQRNRQSTQGATQENKTNSLSRSLRYLSSDLSATNSWDKERDYLKSHLQPEIDRCSKLTDFSKDYGNKYKMGKFVVDPVNNRSIRKNLEANISRNTQNNWVRENYQVRASRHVYNNTIGEKDKEIRKEIQIEEPNDRTRRELFRKYSEDRSGNSISSARNRIEELSHNFRIEGGKSHRENAWSNNVFKESTQQKLSVLYTSTMNVSRLNSSFNEMEKYSFESYVRAPRENLCLKETERKERSSTPYRTPYISIYESRSHMASADSKTCKDN